MSTGTRTDRLVYIDLARGFAIALALFSHFMLGTGGWSSIGDDDTILKGLRVITRTATPTFIMLFGMSSGLAYVHRWGIDRGETIRRLMRRAIQCYIALVAVAVAAAFGGLVSGKSMLAGFVFMASVPNGNIFTFYVFALFIALALIPLRRAVGIIPTLAVTATWWPIAAYIRHHVEIPEELDVLASRLLGIGSDFGPSAFHAQALVVVGMAIAAYLKEPSVARARIDAAVTVAVTGAAVIITVAMDGVWGAAAGFTSAYRATNSFSYYAIGGVLAIMLLVVCWAISRLVNSHRRGAFGRNSLQAFAIGNVILNLFIGHIAFTSFWAAAAGGVAFIAIFWAAFRVWLRVYETERFDWLRRLANGTPRRVPAPDPAQA